MAMTFDGKSITHKSFFQGTLLQKMHNIENIPLKIHAFKITKTTNQIEITPQFYETLLLLTIMKLTFYATINLHNSQHIYNILVM